MKKIEYIKQSLKNVDKEILKSKINIPNTNKEVMFIEYCAKYVPNIMDDDFNLTDSEFITTMEDLINYQIYKFEKNNPKINDVEETIENILKETEEELIYNEKENIDTEENINETEHEENNENLASEIVSKHEEPIKMKPKIPREQLVPTIKKKYKDVLKYVIEIGNTPLTLEEYIDSISGMIDKNGNIIIMDKEIPFEDEVKEKAELAKKSYINAKYLYKNIKYRDFIKINLDQIKMCVRSVMPNFSNENIYYKLAQTMIEKSFDSCNKNITVEKLYKEISEIHFNNNELLEDINNYFKNITRSEMNDLLKELDIKHTDITNQEIDEPRYVQEAKENILKIHYDYESLDKKEIEALAKLKSKMTLNLSDLEQRLKEKLTSSLKTYYLDEYKYRELIKIDYDFHSCLEDIRNRFKRFVSEYENSQSSPSETYFILFNSLSKELESAFKRIEKFDIISKQDQILREEIDGMVSYLKEDMTIPKSKGRAA